MQSIKTILLSLILILSMSSFSSARSTFINGTNGKTITLAKVKQVVANGANVNDRGYDDMTPLMNACIFSNDPEIIKYLISEGANIHATDYNNKHALLLALTENKNNNRSKIIKILLDNGAKVSPDILKYINSTETDTAVIKLFKKYQ